MSREIIYRRNELSVLIRATIGKSMYDQDDGEGIVTRSQVRDFLINTRDLTTSIIGSLPKAGDTIVEIDDESEFTYEVMAMGSEPPWRYSDPSEPRNSIRWFRFVRSLFPVLFLNWPRSSTFHCSHEFDQRTENSRWQTAVDVLVRKSGEVGKCGVFLTILPVSSRVNIGATSSVPDQKLRVLRLYSGQTISGYRENADSIDAAGLSCLEMSKHDHK